MFPKQAWIFGLSLIGVVVVLGCGGGLPSKGRLKTMLAEAASTTETDLSAAEEFGYWSEVENQSLTVVFAGTRPSEAPCAWESELPESAEPSIIESLGVQWTIGELQRCLTRPESERRGRVRFDAGSGDRIEERRASLLCEEFITGVEISADGDVAHGVVAFDRPGCFRGEVPFSMSRGDEGWDISSFDLLDSGWKVERRDGGVWRPRRMQGPPSLPNLDYVERYVHVDLLLDPDGYTRIRLNTQPAVFEDLLPSVAGQVVYLRTDSDLAGGQFSSTIESLAHADPPVLAVFLQPQRMLDMCRLLGIAQTPMQALLSRSSLAGPSIQVARTRLPREAIALCVGSKGTTMRLSGAAQIQVDKSPRDAVLIAMEEVSCRPSLPVLISVEPAVTFSQVDTALDLAAQSQTGSIFLRTSRHRGVLFERRDRARPEPRPPMVRRTPKSGRANESRKQEAAAASPHSPVPGEPYRFIVGGEISEPVKIDGPSPIYPDAAKRARIQGVVVLEAVIGTDGLVQDLNALRPLPLGLTEAAEDAVRRSRYKPATLRGEPVPVKYIIPVRFNLQ